MIKILIVSFALSLTVDIFGLVLSEKEFLYRTLQQSYQLRIISNTIDSAIQKNIAGQDIYNPELYSKINYSFSTNNTNSFETSVLAINNTHFSTGIRKYFSTGTGVNLSLDMDMTKALVPVTTMDPASFSFSNYTSEKNETKPKISLNIVQPILKDGIWDLPGQAVLDLRELEKDITVLGAKMAIEGMVFENLVLYHSFISYLEIQKLNSDSCEDASNLQKRYSAKYNLGVVSKITKLMIDNEYIQETLNKEDSSQQLRSALLELTFLLKNKPDDFSLYDTNEGLVFVDSMPEERQLDEVAVINEALKNENSLLQSELIMKSYRLNTRIINNSTLPELNTLFSISYKGFSSGNSALSESFNHSLVDYYAGLEFRMPFLTQTEIAKNLQAEFDEKNKSNSYYLKKDTVELEIKKTLNKLNFLRNMIKEAEQAVIINKNIVVEAEKDFNNGKISAKDLIDFKKMSRLIQAKSIQLRLDYRLGLIKLELQKGTLLKTYGLELNHF